MHLAHSARDRAARIPLLDPRIGFDALAFDVLLPDHPHRSGLERFIARRYAGDHGARIAHFARRLIGLRAADGRWLAGAGYTLAAEQPLYLEQYLDRPIEWEIAARAGQPVERNRIVEVGNLAATAPGAARSVILRLAELLDSLELAWVAFTATQALLNSFARLGVDLVPITGADPLRLPDRGESWGRYYLNNPRVIAASIPAGVRRLRSIARSLRPA